MDKKEQGFYLVGELVNSYQKTVGEKRIQVTCHQVHFTVVLQDGSQRVLQFQVDDFENRKMPLGPVKLPVRVSCSVSKNGKGFVNLNMR